MDAVPIGELIYCWSCHRIFDGRYNTLCPYCNSSDFESVEDVEELMDLEDLQHIGVL